MIVFRNRYDGAVVERLRVGQKRGGVEGGQFPGRFPDQASADLPLLPSRDQRGGVRESQGQPGIVGPALQPFAPRAAEIVGRSAQIGRPRPRGQFDTRFVFLLLLRFETDETYPQG